MGERQKPMLTSPRCWQWTRQGALPATSPSCRRYSARA